MDYKKELEVISETGCYETFWDCLHFLNTAGYNNADSFGIALLAFNENEIWDNVAFIRLDGYVEINRDGNGRLETNRVIMNVGLLDDVSQLKGLFDIYRKAVAKVDGACDVKDFEIKELENNTKVIKLGKISELYLRFIGEISVKYYGYNLVEKQLNDILAEFVQQQRRNDLWDSIRQNPHI